MKKIYLILGYVVLLLISCKQYDDIALWNMTNSQEQRLMTLEELCREMNTNIEALQILISGVQNGDYILNISPVKEEGVEIGYTVTFAKSGTITIYHGKNGQKGDKGDKGEDGECTFPEIGLKQDNDGIYYWTLNKEWLFDDSGKKVKASGCDGQDGESAYELAREKGYTGTLEEWLVTLKGETGESGKSAYEIAVEKGYSGSEIDWLETLKGTNGLDGKTPQLKIENGRWLLSIDNGSSWEDIGQATGDKGQAGTNGDAMFKKIDYTTNNDYVIFILADDTEIKVPKHSSDGSSLVGKLAITFSETTDIIVKPLVDYVVTYTIKGAKSNINLEIIEMGGFKTKVIQESNTTGSIIITPPNILPEQKKVIILFSELEGGTCVKTLTFQYENESSLYIPFSCELKKHLTSSEFNYDLNKDGEITIAEALDCKKSLSLDKTTKLKDLKDIQYFKNIYQLVLSEIPISNLDNNYFPYLKLLSLWGAPNVHSLNMSAWPLLTDLALNNLEQLEALDISQCVNLDNLNCNNNPLLTELDISSCRQLRIFSGSSNTKLKSLKIGACTNLEKIFIEGCALNSLDISMCTNLVRLDVGHNVIDKSELNKIFENLPQGKTWYEGNQKQQSTIYINNNPGTDTCDKSIAENKGWIVK